jgi:CHAD domain-containing protein
VSAGQSTGELAFAVLREQFTRCLAHEPGTRIGVDIEELHDMRVASRRLRSALRTFRSHLPEPSEEFVAEFRWLGNVLGEVRDLDIQIEQVAEWRRSADDTERSAFEPVELVLYEQRERARQHMLAELDSERYDTLVTRFTAFLERGSVGERGRMPAVLSAPRLIEEHFRKVNKNGASLTPSSEAERFHRLRIRCKQLRYAFEFHAPLYGDESRKIIRRLVRLQDLLGRHQDAYASIARIRAVVREGPALPPAALFLLGRLAERYLAEAATLRERFPATFKRLRGQVWTRFRETMHAATGVVPSPPPSVSPEPPPRPEPPRSTF